MTAITRTSAKQYFLTGSFPTESQFADVFDSTIFQIGTSAQTIQSPVSASAKWDFRSDIFVSGTISAGAIVANSLNIANLSVSGLSVTGRISADSLNAATSVSSNTLSVSSSANIGGDLTVAGSAQTNLTGNVVVSGIATFAQGLTRVVNYTRDLSLSSGSQTLTGAGFRPHGARVIMGQAGTNRMSMSQTDGTMTACVLYNVSGNTFSTSFGGTLVFVQDIAGIQEYTGTFTAFTSDGLTINWTRVGTPTGTIQFSVEYTR